VTSDDGVPAEFLAEAASFIRAAEDPDGKNIEIVETGKYLVASNIHAGEGCASFDAPVVIGKH
jgi:hypothetical protein